MKENEAVCSNCGAVCNKYMMESFVTGRRVQYMCLDCYKIGSHEALIRAMVNQVRTKKQKEKNRQ